MTNKKLELALAFLKSQPAVVAGIFEQQPVENVASFLGKVPHNYGAPVIEKMLPQHAAKICVLLDPTICAGFFSVMDISTVTSVFRYLNQEKRKEILALLPEKVRLAVKLLLSYPVDAVGAWMVVNVGTLPNDIKISDALKQLTIQDGILNGEEIYVLDRQGQLKGVITFVSLLQASPDISITAIMKTGYNKALHGRTSLLSVQNHEGWLTNDVLPVINRNNQLVGILRHVDLRKGVEQLTTSIDIPKGDDFITNIFEIYGNSLVALFNSLCEMTHSKPL